MPAFTAGGVGLYAVSYDDWEALRDFASAHAISYRLLSDPDSAVITAFGILNTLVPDDESTFRGIPFPGAYVIDGDGVIVAKFFEDTYQMRPGPDVLLGAALGRPLTLGA